MADTKSAQPNTVVPDQTFTVEAAPGLKIKMHFGGKNTRETVPADQVNRNP